MQSHKEEKEGEQTSYMLSDKIFYSIFEKKDLPKKDKPVIFSPDYDGSFDFFHSLARRIVKVCCKKNMNFVNKLLFPLLLLLKYLDTTYSNINVVCGSARQTHATDKWNREKLISSYSSYYEKFPDLICKPHEGYAFTDFQKLVNDIKNSPNTNSEWNFWPLLFGDGTKNPDGTEKQDGYTMSSKDENAKELDSDKMKTDLIKFQILRARKKFKSDNFDFVFIDDRKDILGAIKKMLEGKPEWFPPKVNVFLYHFDWFERSTNALKKDASSLDKDALKMPELFYKI